MAGNLYVHKVFPHDIIHEVGFTQDIHYMFFNSSCYLSFTKAHSAYIYNITVNDATDLRFGGDFMSMLPHTSSVGDFICIEKRGITYNLSVLSGTSETAQRYNMILGIRQRHMIFENGSVIYKR